MADTPESSGEMSRSGSTNHLSPSRTASYSSSPRPGLSRASSVSYFSTEADDSFTGLTLLDALVALDSHLDLASRNLKKKGLEWKSKAEYTANTVKRQAEEVINQGRKKTRGLRSTSYGDVRRRGTRTAGAGNTDDDEEEDRIYIDKEVARLRENISNRVQAVRAKWKEQRIVSLRDKLSFFFGVELVLFSALLVGFKPEWVPGAYTALSLYLFPIRIYEYRKKSYSFFLADLCYIVNVLCLLYIWVFPGSPILYVACYCLSHGPLCTAIATWRNSLVFHSVDKVTSLFIHIYPPFVFTVLRHFYPNVEAKYPALAELPSLNLWRSMLFTSLIYLAWQTGYYYGIIVARKAEIEKKGKITSFTYMLHNKRSLIGKTLAKIPPKHRELSFMVGQYIYTIVTMAPSVIWLYDSKVLNVSWLIIFFSVSVWNGASFYFKVMDNFKDIAALRKELDELQKEAEGRRTPVSAGGVSTPGTSATGPLADSSTNDIQELSLGESMTSAVAAVVDKHNPPVESAAQEGLMDATTLIHSHSRDTAPRGAGDQSGPSTSAVSSEGSPVVPELPLGRDSEHRLSSSAESSDGSAVVVEKE